MAGTRGSIAAFFASLPDPRVDRNKKHLLADVLTIALCAVVGGADTWEEVEQFGRCKEAFLRRFLKLPNGIPSHDTFNRVFALLDPDAFAACFGRWMAAVCERTGLVQVAVDGKAVRGAPGRTHSGCLHLVTAWATANGVALGQRAVADGSNEIAAIPGLLRVLDLDGALVTIDAAGCQRDIARQVREQGGDYLLAVKGNQPALRAAVVAAFDRAAAAEFAGCDQHEAVDDGHGRHEERYVTVLSDPPGLPPGWPDVASVVLVGREREVKGANTSTTHYYLTSRRGTAAEMGRLIRSHWGIENGLHWVLDVAFREDASRTRDRNAGANLGYLRRVATTLLRRAEGKGSMKAKRLKAGWDDHALRQILQGIPQVNVR